MKQKIAQLYKKAKARQFFSRCVVVGLLLAFVASLCLGQLVAMQLIGGRATALAATESRTLNVTLSAQRGRILDANGSVLAQSVDRYTIAGDPEAAQAFTPITCKSNNTSYCHEIDGQPVGVTGAAAVARLLATVLDMDAKEIGAKLSGSGQYAVIAKDVTPEVKRKISELHLGGIVWGELSNERLYTNPDLMGSLLGGVDSEGTGVAGLEQSLNDTLTGTDGHESYQQGNGGEEIPGTVTESEPAVNGEDVTLTIDSDVQWYVRDTLKQGVSKYGATWGIAVVQDIQTGEILALADSDDIESGSDDAKLNTSRAVSETFEPGSIGKLISAAGYLQTGQHKMTDQFTVANSITIDGQTIHDYSAHATSNWTLAGILQQSSNVGMIMAAENYTDEQRYEFLQKFGIGQPTGLNLPGESQGLLYEPSNWDARTRNTVLFGQGYTVNALQLNNIVATIANKGVRLQQSIIKSTTDANGKTTETKKADGTRVLDESVAAEMMNAMETVSENYKFVKVDGYRLAAKSGTSEVQGADGRLSSIISDYSIALPADNPKYAVTVIFKDPHGVYGGVTAGPVAAQIGTFLMQKYNVPTSSERENALSATW